MCELAAYFSTIVALLFNLRISKLRKSSLVETTKIITLYLYRYYWSSRYFTACIILVALMIVYRHDSQNIKTLILHHKIF